jgi:hypothetical protein
LNKLPNIIFLDMDGVLCTPRACVAMGDTGGVYAYLDPIACALVRKLCEDHNAKIVVSSAWRKLYNYLAFGAILDAACPRLGRYLWPDNEDWRTVSYVPNDDFGSNTDRGREILDWVKRHETEFNNFVVLDDMMDMRPVDHALVLCNYYDGLSYQNYEDAAKILAAKVGID